MKSEYDPRSFPPFAVTVDLAIFTIDAGRLMTAVVLRAQPPHQGEFALPGGFVTPGEDLDEAARRELIEETGLKTAVPHLAQFRSYGDPERDPRMRVVTVAYWAIVPSVGIPTGGGDAASAHLVSVDDLLSGQVPLAFDHHQILGDALEEARRALETTTVATGFCDEELTIPELRQVYEIVWGVRLDPGNFQKKVTDVPGFVIPTGNLRHGGPGRPAETYLAGPAAAIDPPFRRPAAQTTHAPEWAWADLLRQEDAPSRDKGIVLAMMDRPNLTAPRSAWTDMPLRPDAVEPLPTYPLLDRDLFDQLPKAKKTKDMQRMLHSPNSEDWVTWNVVRLLSRRPWKTWWPHLLDIVSRSAGEQIDLPPPDRVDLWRTVPAPLAYERASRERMLASDNQAWLARAAKSKPVEGESEIDVSLSGEGYLAYVEAKLGSDISLRTTYDPYRNQMVRNIDCVLEYSKGRRPHFWMFTRDRGPERSYVQLLERYRREPAVLADELPHRSPRKVDEIIRTLAVITWGELLEVVEPTNQEEEAVLEELRIRVR